MPNDTNYLWRAGERTASITDEWSDDPAIVQTQAPRYVGLRLERIADALEEQSQ